MNFKTTTMIAGALKDQLIQSINHFFERPGINKAGICKEANITPQYLNRVLQGKQPLTQKFIKLVFPSLHER